MGAASARLEGHDAYLHALNRALRVGLVLSVAVHAALVGTLPSPFHHQHPQTQALQVEIVEARPPSPQPGVAEPSPLDQPATPVPFSRPPTPKTEPARSRRPIAEPKSTREQLVAAAAARDTERVLSAIQPERAAAAAPDSPPAGATKASPEPALTTVAKDASGEASPELPPSFRAAYLRNPEPHYPAVSRRLAEQGSVQLRVLVTAEGRPARVDLHRSSGFSRLDEAAAAAVREWRFVPAKHGSTPVEAAVIVPIVFRLDTE
jgi:protein TonB